MKKILALFLLLTIAACTSGEFTPERHALYDLGRPDCEKTPDKCVQGYPW